MIKYVVLTSDSFVAEVLPDFAPCFPDIPIEQRFSKEFLDATIKIENGKEPPLNWYYDRKTGQFTEPPVFDSPPLPEPAPDPIDIMAVAVVDLAYEVALMQLGLA